MAVGAIFVFAKIIIASQKSSTMRTAVRAYSIPSAPDTLYGAGGSPTHSGLRAHTMPTSKGETYHVKSGREMYTKASPTQLAATPAISAQWLAAQAQARAAAQPRIGPHSQLDAPVVSSLDPQSMTQNPLDPYLENITYHLSTFRNRNSNFDPRGQPALDQNFLIGTDQLVNPRNLERLAYHGPSHQITGCSEARPPRY